MQRRQPRQGSDAYSRLRVCLRGRLTEETVGRQGGKLCAILRARNEGRTLPFLDSVDARSGSQRIVLPEISEEVWHGYLPDLRPGQLQSQAQGSRGRWQYCAAYKSLPAASSEELFLVRARWKRAPTDGCRHAILTLAVRVTDLPSGFPREPGAARQRSLSPRWPGQAAPRPWRG